MKENKYDNEQFFDKYRHFPRSVEGLTAAGEWHELKKLLPNFAHKRVLDIGCGFGWHCIYAAQNGADYVLGTDISTKMLQIAKQKNHLVNVEYQKIAMEDIDFPPDSFDIVISSLALHYTPDFYDICQKIYHCLSAKGSFVFSVEHPVFTANSTQDWCHDNNNVNLYWPIDNYFEEGPKITTFLNEKVIKYHKTLTTYINTLLKSGFTITSLVEPMPAEHLLNTIPAMKDELRRPMMLLIAAQKV